MKTELEIVTPHLRGSCMTVGNQLHGLFKVAGRKPDAQENAWLSVRRERAAASVAEDHDTPSQNAARD